LRRHWARLDRKKFKEETGSDDGDVERSWIGLWEGDGKKERNNSDAKPKQLT